jgi:hypothetical protein
MSTGNQDGLSAPLVVARQRFERWRRNRKIGSRIPETLWEAAVKAANKYGVAQTSRALSLDYHTLKNRLERMPDQPGKNQRKGRVNNKPRKQVKVACPGAASAGEAEAAFLELPPSTSGCFPECILELEDDAGAKMRIHFKGMEAPDLAALSRRFWGSE